MDIAFIISYNAVVVNPHFNILSAYFRKKPTPATDLCPLGIVAVQCKAPRPMTHAGSSLRKHTRQSPRRLGHPTDPLGRIFRRVPA